MIFVVLNVVWKLLDLIGKPTSDYPNKYMKSVVYMFYFPIDTF